MPTYISFYDFVPDFLSMFIFSPLFILLFTQILWRRCNQMTIIHVKNKSWMYAIRLYLKHISVSHYLQKSV